MEFHPVDSDEIVELLINQGHVTTRRPHHGERLARYIIDSYSHDKIVNVWRDEVGRFYFDGGKDIGTLCFAIAYSDFARDQVLTADDERVYRFNGIGDKRMTYRRDLTEGIDPQHLINCWAAYDIYALLQGPEGSARFVAGVDEICEATSHKIHCTIGRGSTDYRTQFDRLSYDEEFMERMLNILKLRSFLSNSKDLEIIKFPYLYDTLREGERYLSTMSLEIDGANFAETDYGYVGEIHSSRVSINTTLGVMLDTELYKFIWTCWKDLGNPFLNMRLRGEIKYLEKKGFKLAKLMSGKIMDSD